MNKLVALLLLLILVPCFFSQAQFQLDLERVIELAQENSIDAKIAETRKESAYWSYRIFKSEYNPSVVLTGAIPGYDRNFLENRLDDGTIVYQTREQLQSSVGLFVEQPLALTGGTIALASRLRQFQDVSSELTRWNSTLVNIEFNQPLFAFNELKWDKRTQPIVYEESKRSYVEQLEAVSQQAVQRFFDFLDQQIGLQIAEYNLGKNETNYKIEEGRYNIGTATEDALLNVQLQLLTSQGQITQAGLDLQQASLELRRFLGIVNDTARIILTLPEKIPDFEIQLDRALGYAKDNRSDFIQFERRRIEAEARVAEQKAFRYSADLEASFGLNDAGTSLNQAYSNPDNQQRFNLGLRVPILDFGRGKSRVRQAQAFQQLENFSIQQEVQAFEQEIVTLVGRIEMMRTQIEIKQKGDEVAQRRYDVAQNRYLTGGTTITDLTLALEQKDQAKREYINALRDFWDSYYLLRRLTLYDFAENKRLYTVDDR